MRGLAILALLVVASGCFGNPSRTATVEPESEANVRPQPPVFAYTGCKELNLLVPARIERFSNPHFRPIASDPAGLTTTHLLTAMRCERLEDRGRNTTDWTGFFGLIQVQPAADLVLPQAAGYLWLHSIATTDAVVRAAWAERGVLDEDSPVALRFTEFATARDSRVHMEAAGLVADASMAGPLARGAAGTLGLYTGNATTPPSLHRIEFSAYSYYGRGLSTLSPGPWLPPAHIPATQPVPANANLDYGATFHLDIAPQRQT